MNCPSCNAAIADGSVACPSCGAQIGAAAPVGGAPAAPSAGAGAGGGMPPVAFDLNRLALGDKIAGGAALLLLIDLLFFDWYKVSFCAGPTGFGSFCVSASAKATAHGWMWITFILDLVVVAYVVARTLWEKLPFDIPLEHWQILLIGTGVTGVLSLIGFLDKSGASWDFGAYIGIVCAIAAVVGAVLVKTQGSGTPAASS